jgi:competence protein ComEC
VGRTLLAGLIETQRPHLALWLPVLFACGIGVYFSLAAEPERWMLVALAAALGLVAASVPRVGGLPRILLALALTPGLGFAAAAVRTHAVAAPVLAAPATVAVEGRLVGLDRSGSNRPRILLDRVVIHGLDPARTPERLRVSLDASTPESLLVPGRRLIGQARLSPPPAPSEPGGFDFRQLAWFDRIGAVGYTRTPFLEAGSVDTAAWETAVFALRIGLSRAIRAAIPGENGGFAAAILTGDRSAVDPVALQALRDSNLAHLLAISGLHMGLLSGFVFALVRIGIVLVPGAALRLPAKKIAAVAALLAGAGYLLLSGANVATQRAFIMTAVVLVAVLIDRPAFTLRSVALAALVVLALRPESLTEAGFQMSFAATTALIAAFNALRRRAWWRESHASRWRFLRPILGVVVTSLVAGVATAPISAFHFNVMSRYGLVANVLAVPAMGLVIMPAAVLAGLLAPLGLASPALVAMDAGIGYVLAVAGHVAGLDGAVRHVPAGPGASLVLIALGGLVVILVIGRARLLGLAPMLAGLALWSAADRPDILISEDGRLFGVRTEEGLVLNSARGNAFAAGIWLGNDGDGAGQEAAYARAPMLRSRGRAEIEVPGLGRLIYRGSRLPDDRAEEDCAAAAILLAPSWSEAPAGGCLFIGADRLRRDGALAIRLTTEGPVLDGARARNRARPWTRDPALPARLDRLAAD